MSRTPSLRRHPQADELVKLHGMQALSVDDTLPYTPPEPEPEVTLFGRTDTDNGRRLVHWFGKDLRYLHELRAWFIWNGCVFERDRTERVRGMAREVAERIPRELSLIRAGQSSAASPDDRERMEKEVEAHMKWSAASMSTRRLDSMLREAGSMYPVATVTDAFDQDPWLLAVHNGVLDLRSCTLTPPDRASLLTLRLGTAWSEHATCPMWERTLRDVFEEDPETIGWFQKFAGYTLTGSTEEQVVFLFYGSGANGKSTLLETLQYVLGPFARTSPPGLLMQKRMEHHPTELADLWGARLVVGSEADQDGVFDEALLKRLTGSDRIRARFMRKDFFEFRPTHKLVLGVNHLPNITGTDAGIKRRLVVLPFRARFTGANRDRTLPDKLRREAPGILRWLIEGCRRWQQEGLGTCPAVDRAVREYDEDTNVVGRFLAERCSLDATAWTPKAELYRAFLSWSAELGMGRWSDRTLRQRCLDHGLVEHRRNSARGWVGVRLRLGSGPNGDT